jgi:hypothetical protein
MYRQSGTRSTLLVTNRIYSVSSRWLYALLIALGFSMQAGGFAVTGARAGESSESVYPGRYAVNCKPAPIAGCVCQTDPSEPTRQIFQTAGELDEHDDQIRDTGYLRMMEWVRATCIAVNRPGGLR